MRSLFALLLLASASVAAPPAHAETELCTEITSVPTTITTAGVYCMKKDLATSITTGRAIQVAANNVVIDCNDRRLGGLAAGTATQTVGIYADDRANITVRNCSVRGFHTGISVGQSCGMCVSTGHLVENNLVDSSTKIGIFVDGDDVVVRGNRVTGTGGSVLGGDVIGMRVHGHPAVAADNYVTTVTGPPFAADTLGIHVSGYETIARGNFVGMVIDGSDGASSGIRVGGTTVGAIGNVITGDSLDFGIEVVYGAFCVDNVVREAANAYDGCTDGGGNFPDAP